MARLKIAYSILLTFVSIVSVDGMAFCRPQILTEKGDVRLAAIIDIHETKNNNCGPISDTNFQIAAAIKWTVDILNGGNDSENSFIPGVKIGYEIYDDCGLEMFSSLHATDILKTTEQKDCINTTNTTATTNPLIGVVGTTISQTTSVVSKLFKGTSIPVVGISATLPELSDKTLYPNFIRSVPSDTLQAKVILQLVQKLNWTYIIGIHTDDNYGTEGFAEFQNIAKDADVCISKTLSLGRNNPNISTTIANFMRGLLFQVDQTVGSSLGVVYFGHSLEARNIFAVVKSSISKWHNPNNINSIHWIMSDGIGTSLAVASSHEWLSNLLLSISAVNLKLKEIKDNFLKLLLRYNDNTLSTSWRTRVVEYIRTYFNCDPLHSSPPNLTWCHFSKSSDIGEHYYPSSYISSALDAVYILASMFKTAHRRLCNGQKGVCDNLGAILNNNKLLQDPYKLSHINYRDIGKRFVPEMFYEDNRILSADVNGDFEVKGEALYDINIAQVGQFSKVGEFKNEIIDITNISVRWITPMKSWCKSVCEECLNTEELVYDYIPGDVLILGLFPVHGHGTQFECGEYRKIGSSYISLLSFISSINDLKDKTGINFGGIILDDCYNPLRAINILSMIFSGKQRLIDKLNGHEINIKNIVAVVGAQSSSVALGILPTLGSLGIPLISYSATSSDLDDKINYPYFFRTVPSDTVQVMALLNIVRVLNVTHVSAINVNNNYGKKGIANFKSVAEMNGICVEESIELGEDESQVGIVNAIASLTKTKYVVLFGLNSIAIDILNNINTNSFIFIATETWGRDVNIIQGNRGKVARGSITLSMQTSKVGTNNFKLFLERLRPANESSITWFRSFWQVNFQCNIPGGFYNVYSTDCLPNFKLSEERITSLVNNQRIVQTINAVFAAGLGYKEAVRDSCTNINILTCPKPAINIFADKIKAVKVLPDHGTRFSIFDENSNGNIWFTVNNIQRTKDGSYGYVEVGNYGASGVQFDMGKVLFYGDLGNIISAPGSFCLFQPSCSKVCLDTIVVTTERTDGKHEKNSDKSDNSINVSDSSLVPVVAVLSVLVIILLIFLAVIMFIILKNNISLRERNISKASDVQGDGSGEVFHNNIQNTGPDIRLYPIPSLCSTSTHPTNSSSSGVVTSSTIHDHEEGRIAVEVPITYLSFTNGNTEVISVLSGTSHCSTSSMSPVLNSPYLHAVHLSSIGEVPSSTVDGTIQYNPLSPTVLAPSNASTTSALIHTQSPISAPRRASAPQMLSPLQGTSAALHQSNTEVHRASSNQQPLLDITTRDKSPTISNVGTTDSGQTSLKHLVYKRTLSYITGEELIPIPSPCTAGNSTEQLV